MHVTVHVEKSDQPLVVDKPVFKHFTTDNLCKQVHRIGLDFLKKPEPKEIHLEDIHNTKRIIQKYLATAHNTVWLCQDQQI